MPDGAIVRSIMIGLTREQSRYLDQEINRLQVLYGIKLDLSDIMSLLIDMQRLRILACTEDGNEAKAWMWRRLNRRLEDEFVPGRISATDRPDADEGVASAQGQARSQ